MSKRIKAPFYTKTKLGLKSLFKDTQLPNGCLYSKGRYKTTITPEMLPDHYIPLMVYKVYGFLSTEGIKDIVYKPNYHINHMHKDDFLYISYNSPITSAIDQWGFELYQDYDVLLWGWSIVIFIKAIQKAKSYDIKSIAEEVKRKELFFIEKYPEECEHLNDAYLLK